jgi:plasmid stabilization system protein ParE
LKVTYTEEAVADIVEAITYLNQRNPTAAANLDAEISRLSSAWQTGSLRDRSRALIWRCRAELGRSAEARREIRPRTLNGVSFQMARLRQSPELV